MSGLRPEAAALLERIDAAEARLARQAADPPPGLTEPDASSGEQWDAGQAWAHVAEFVPYWQRQVEAVIAADDPSTPFGRTSTDPGRIGAIEAGRHEPPAEQMHRLAGELEALRGYLRSLPDDAWDRRGVHSRLGEMTVARIVERFIVGHLEEHAEQLERLEAESRG